MRLAVIGTEAARMRLAVMGTEAVRELACTIAGDAGVDLAGTFGEPDRILEDCLASGAGDVLILPHAQATLLTAQGRVALDFCSDLGAIRDKADANAGSGGEAIAATGKQMPTARSQASPSATIHTVVLRPGSHDEVARAFAARLTGRDGALARAAAGFGGIAIARADATCATQARELVFGILREYGFAPEPEATDADLMDLEAGFLADGGMFDVAREPDGRLAACCGMKVFSGERVELRKMYVRQDCRGQGIGQRLLDRALAWARARRFAQVELETASVLKEAIALYRKAGFTPRPGRIGTCRCDQAFVLGLR